MKRLIISFMVLFLLIGIGTKSYGQAAGDYVFTQATDTLWATQGNWSTSDGAGNLTVATRTPTATDNVWIPAGKRMGTVPTTTTGTGVFTSGSATVTLSAANANILVGMAIRNKAFTGANFGITSGTYVSAVSGTTVTLSQPVTMTSSGVSLEFYPACKNLNVTGFIRTSSTFVVFGDITVNAAGILTEVSDLYCTNIYNYGKFNSNTGYRSNHNLYVGYTGAAPGAGDYVIINDGVFGDPKITFPATSTNTSYGGIIVTYSNQANSMTIKPSSSAVTNYAFNIAQLQPTGYIKTTANTTLNVNETMSLLGKSGLDLSVQNNDTSINTTRTCNIPSGVTIYMGNNFHSNRSVTTNPQGNFVYNVYGTMDLGSYASYSNDSTQVNVLNTTDFGLCMTSVVGNTGSLTFNLGDGTQGHAGTLILGSYVQIIKQRTQTIAINLTDFSTVRVRGNYGQVMNYQLLNSNVPALYLFPKNFYNLTLNGASAILPLVPAIKGTKTFTKTYATFVAPALTPVVNWIAATTAVQGSILYTGAGYYYVPVVRGASTYLTNNPITLVADTILNYLKVGQTASGNNIPAGTTISAITGNSITLSAAPNATATQTNVFVTFTGKSGAVAPAGTSTDTNAPVLDGTQSLIYLGGNEFPTASTVITTAVNSPSKNNVLIYSDQRNSLVISNATAGDIASVYSVSGVKVASAKLTSDNTTLSIPSGIYLVKINASVSKVIVR